MKRKIFLHGKLKKLCPDGLEIDAATVAEAIRGMCAVTGGAFNPIPGKGRHQIAAVGFPTKESFFEPLPAEVTELHLMPAFVGGKQGGVMQVVIGVVIMVAAVIAAIPTGGGSLALGTSVLWGMTTAGGLLFAGAMMAMGGLLNMMSPSPKMDTGSSNYSSTNNPEASKYLGSPQNTTKLGTRIPILYGRTRVYGHILSLSIQATDVAV